MKKRILSLALAFVLTLALVPAFTAPAQAAGAWQDAYAGLLNGKTGEFILHDIDKNGTPELVIAGGDMFNQSVDIYTYSGGNAVPLVEELYMNGFAAFQTPQSGNGLIMIDYAIFGADKIDVHYFFTLAGNKLTTKSGSTDYEYYHVDGKEVSDTDYWNVFEGAEMEAYTINAANIKKYITDTAASTNTKPHYFATALETYFHNATETAAILTDLNGDGTDEMVAIKNDAGKYSNGYEIAVFDQVKMQYPPVSVNVNTGGGQIYISNKNYIVVELAVDFGPIYPYGYDNGQITMKVDWDKRGEEIYIYYPYEIASKKEISTAVMNEKYGINSIKYMLTGAKRAVQTAEILAMTAAPVADKPSSWAETQVSAAIAANLIPPSLQSQYTESTTRAEFCALAVALYEKQKGVITGRTTFTDTSDVNVQKAASIGIVSGVGNNKFSPDTQLTREQAAVMLTKLSDAIGKPLPKKATTFADKGSMASWAVEAVGQIQAAGIMSGIGDNKFAPQNPYTREQSIITIMKLYDAVK